MIRNYWIIGDIHGEIGLLDQLLDNILKFRPEQIVFVGDYIDRGSHSREVIDRIMNLEVDTVCLMGNHEMMMLNAMEDMGYGGNPIELWYYNGGEATLQSFGFSSFFGFQAEMPSIYLNFFQKLKMSHTLEIPGGSDILITHAGISPAIPLSDQVRLNNYHELNRYLLDKHLDPGDSFLWVRDAFFAGSPEMCNGYVVVHGHTPVLKLKRFISSNGPYHFLFVDNDLCIRREPGTGKLVSIDIDSGSVISGRLSGLGFFIEREGSGNPWVRMRSITVSSEDIFPRDLGPVNGTSQAK